MARSRLRGTARLIRAILWPLTILATIFLTTLGHRRAGGSGGAAPAPDRLDEIVAFGGLQESLVTDRFRGGRLTTVLGGAEVDLRQASLPDEGAHLDLSATFGGILLHVPEDWRVALTGSATFGGIANNTEPPEDPDAPVLHIHASALFGGVTVGHGPDACGADGDGDGALVSLGGSSLEDPHRRP